ncbi:MAG: hypothetical protein C4309_05185, partial [Chloroflexota bacterium]
MVQLPLPPHLDEEEILGAIPLEKDVDGFHPWNIGRLGLKGRDPYFVPCTPLGILTMLQEAQIPIAGRRAVVLGRSRIVGLPMALLLLRLDATVTVCHSRTPHLAEVTRQADLLIVAAGAILAASILRGLFTFGQSYLGEWLSQHVAFDIRNAIYERLQRLSYAYHDKAQIGQIMSRATQDVEG